MVNQQRILFLFLAFFNVIQFSQHYRTGCDSYYRKSINKDYRGSYTNDQHSIAATYAQQQIFWIVLILRRSILFILIEPSQKLPPLYNGKLILPQVAVVESFELQSFFTCSASDSSITGYAITAIASNQVNTFATILARCRCTLVYI